MRFLSWLHVYGSDDPLTPTMAHPRRRPLSPASARRPPLAAASSAQWIGCMVVYFSSVRVEGALVRFAHRECLRKAEETVGHRERFFGCQKTIPSTCGVVWLFGSDPGSENRSRKLAELSESNGMLSTLTKVSSARVRGVGRSIDPEFDHGTVSLGVRTPSFCTPDVLSFLLLLKLGGNQLISFREVLFVKANMTTLSPPPGFGVPLLQSQTEKPKRSKDRRVTWAANDKLCQVRLFVAEDAPVLSGGIQEQLQAKQARFMHIFQSSVKKVALEDAPPGFGGVAVKPKADPAALALIIAQIPWRRPDTCMLDPAWKVTAGDESLEKDLQKERCFRVLEAVYPRPSSIPESPAEPSEEQESYDDTQTQQIPLVPVDDEDMADANDGPTTVPRVFPLSTTNHLVAALSQRNQSASPNLFLDAVKTSTLDSLGFTHEGGMEWRDDGISGLRGRISSGEQTPDLLSGRPSSVSVVADSLAFASQSGVEPDIAAAAAAAYAALAKSKEVGSMIDNNLLIQLLKDPSLMQSLTSKQSFSFSNSHGDFCSTMGLGATRAPEKANQTQNANTVVTSSQWPTVAPIFPSPVGSVQDGSNSRVADGSQANDRFQRNGVTDERLPQPFTPVPLSSGPTFPDMINGRVGSTEVSRHGVVGSGPPGFGSGSAPPGFGSNLTSGQGTQLATSLTVAPVSARPLSRHDEQYFKELIMQHGKSANDDDLRRVFDGQGNPGAPRSRVGGEMATVRLFGGMSTEDDSVRFDRNRRDGERSGSGLEQTRPKSRKTCIYYGTSRGCRNGSSCAFVHELGPEKVRVDRMRTEASQISYAKRLKVDG
ncbi:hypothetical protein R1flu_024668 [Riccia fluitans]|uniref:C3H1-type domain-containing protein n=1 Tax=Riccia fluitans TaxID=41844 RepID=A0ABD1XYI6_9MARC